MERNADTIPQKSMYKLLTGSILPRPIGWISTIDAEGAPNLAPYSFFNAIGSNPPHVLFCPNVRGADQSEKDTLQNVRVTGEFVVNIVTEALAEAMNATSAELPAGVNEFEAAGLKAAPSVVVKPPRVAESPVHFECTLTQIVDLNAGGPGGGYVVIGRVVHVHVDDAVLIGEDKINLATLQPIGRLAGMSYTRVTDLFDLTRPPSEIK
jgi:flavin reductase (DIM6/NTAB) family NADH-FMN oxidoreductase RutF